MDYEWLVVWLVDELEGIGCMNDWLSQCDLFIDCDWLNVIDWMWLIECDWLVCWLFLWLMEYDWMIDWLNEMID